MKKIQYTKSPGVPHLSMEEEFLYHKNGPEWWYATGYMNDESGKLFTFQFTLAKIWIYGVKFNILMTAVTDFETGKHHYAQQSIFFEKNVIITADRVGIDGEAEMTFESRKLEGKKLGLNMTGKDYSLTLDINAAKPPVWHCDNGVLRMGIDAPQQQSYYWSYTNLAVSGKLVLEGKEHKVTGKGWFDKQGGPYNPLDRRTSWEWFSLRFFDNEEVMLFSFPQDNYQDGTFINKSGGSRRLNDYKITPLGWTEAGRYKFSSGWRVEMNGLKDQEYTIVPKIDGQLNLFYFEQLADIKDKTGQVVGYCFVELLPGVYNETPISAAFRRVR
jgi:predicted secreted hydrolase